MSTTRTTSDISKDSYPAPRTIVLCFDGTNGQYDSKNTNVVKFFGLLNKDCPDKQVAYYQAGIGTYFAPGVVSPLWLRFASLMDEGVAWYLDAHVMAGYKFLMENYHTGDKICIFGFSRGAYTARALAGMLEKVGLLPKDNLQQISFAYKAYTRTDKEGTQLAAGFKQTFSQDVKVEFVGVWDTVESTGVLINRVLPFTDSNNAIKVFRHALSLDEHRSRFRPNLYHWPTKDDAAAEVIDMEGPIQRTFNALGSTLKGLFRKKNSVQVCSTPVTNSAQQDPHGNELIPNGTQLEAEFVVEEAFTTDVLEVWFAGCHSDVGGGNVQDDTKVSLAQITLHWMVEQVIQSQCGINFDGDALARIGFVAPTPASHSLSNSKCVPLPSVCDEPTPSLVPYPEHSDAIAPLFDELKINKMWWILEALPVSYAWQDHNGAWHSKWSINMGRGRLIPYQKPKFHRTVKERMDYKPLSYTPRAIHDHNEIYV